ncbi:MAG: hypothetical protein ACRCVS_03310 [Fusobacteriaceae bacterium]
MNNSNYFFIIFLFLSTQLNLLSKVKAPNSLDEYLNGSKSQFLNLKFVLLSPLNKNFNSIHSTISINKAPSLSHQFKILKIIYKPLVENEPSL